MVSHTFPGIAPIVLSTETFDARLQRALDSKGYTNGFQVLSPTVAANFVVSRLRNPTGSGKNVVVNGAYVSSSVSQRFDFDAPVTPARAALTINTVAQAKRVGAPASIATPGSDNTITVNPVVNPAPSVRLLANQLLYLQLGEILTPNSSMDAVFTGGVTTDLDSFFWDWHEE